MDNKPGKIRTETNSGVFVCGLRIPPRLSPCKTHPREMAQTSGFDPASQVKQVARCLMLLIGLLASTEKMVPEGRLHLRPFQFHLKEHWKYPQLLDNLLPFCAALNRDPTSTTSVNNSAQTIPQLYVPQQSTTSQPPHLVSRSGKLQEQGFSVEVAERIAAPQRSSTRTIYRPYLKNGASFEASVKSWILWSLG